MNGEDLFDAVDALEKQEYAAGEEEGLSKGQQNARQDGFVFGWQQGCHIQQELGRIEGVLSSLLSNCESTINPRLQKQVNKLLMSVREWPQWDPADEEKIEANLASIHIKSRFILKQLKIPSTVVDKSVDGDF